LFQASPASFFSTTPLVGGWSGDDARRRLETPNEPTPLLRFDVDLQVVQPVVKRIRSIVELERRNAASDECGGVFTQNVYRFANSRTNKCPKQLGKRPHRRHVFSRQMHLAAGAGQAFEQCAVQSSGGRLEWVGACLPVTTTERGACCFGTARGLDGVLVR